MRYIIPTPIPVLPLPLQKPADYHVNKVVESRTNVLSQILTFALVSIIAAALGAYNSSSLLNWEFQLTDALSSSGKTWEVFVFTMFGAIACGVGVFPLFMLKKIDSNMQGVCASIAAGVMVMASLGMQSSKLAALMYL